MAFNKNNLFWIIPLALVVIGLVGFGLFSIFDGDDMPEDLGTNCNEGDIIQKRCDVTEEFGMRVLGQECTNGVFRSTVIQDCADSNNNLVCEDARCVRKVSTSGYTDGSQCTYDADKFNRQFHEESPCKGNPLQVCGSVCDGDFSLFCARSTSTGGDVGIERCFKGCRGGVCL